MGLSPGPYLHVWGPWGQNDHVQIRRKSIKNYKIYIQAQMTMYGLISIAKFPWGVLWAYPRGRISMFGGPWGPSDHVQIRRKSIKNYKIDIQAQMTMYGLISIAKFPWGVLWAYPPGVIYTYIYFFCLYLR